jgi:hypothetical protein
MSTAYSPIRLFAYFAWFGAATAAHLGAQMLDLRPGARVRVAAPGVLAGQLEGTVIERNGDSIVVATVQTAQYRIALSSASSISVYQGKSRSLGAWKGALWTGGIIGGLMLAASGGSSEYTGFVFEAAAIYGGIGALIGAAIGAESWSDHAMQPALAVTRNGAGIGARLHF